MPTDESGRERDLLGWLTGVLARPGESWNAAQVSYLQDLLGTSEGARVLASLAVTTLRLRSSGIPPEKMGTLGAVQPAIEAFWSDPSPQTYAKLRIARW